MTELNKYTQNTINKLPDGDTCTSKEVKPFPPKLSQNRYQISTTVLNKSW